MLNRWWLAVLVLIVSGLQAWDANALEAGPGLLVVIAFVLLVTPSAILASVSFGVRISAAFASIVALFGVRALSAAHLPELALAGVFSVVLVLADHASAMQRQRKTRET